SSAQRTRAIVPKAPIDGSRMTARRRARSPRTPRPSAQSARPSWCSAPVSATMTAVARTAATPAPSVGSAATRTPAATRPTSAPTAGNQAAAAPIPSGRSRTGSGATVRKASASAAPATARRTPAIGASVVSAISRVVACGGGHLASPLDAGLLEGRHLGVQGACGRDDRQREQRARRLAEAKAQVEQRLEPELGEHELVSGLGGAVAGDDRLADRRVQARRRERGDADGEAVEDGGQPAARRLGRRAGQRGELEPADREQRLARRERRPVAGDRRGDEPALAREAP